MTHGTSHVSHGAFYHSISHCAKLHPANYKAVMNETMCALLTTPQTNQMPTPTIYTKSPKELCPTAVSASDSDDSVYSDSKSDVDHHHRTLPILVGHPQSGAYMATTPPQKKKKKRDEGSQNVPMLMTIYLIICSLYNWPAVPR